MLNCAPHPALLDLLGPIQALHDDVKRKSVMRLQYDGAKVDGDSEKQAKVAMAKYAYYVCFKCEKPYFGGDQVCAAAAGNEYDPSELVCGACVGGAAAQVWCWQLRFRFRRRILIARGGVRTRCAAWSGTV